MWRTDGVQDYVLDPLAYAAEVAWRKGIVLEHKEKPVVAMAREELNIVEENITDRPWYLRRFMRK